MTVDLNLDTIVDYAVREGLVDWVSLSEIVELARDLIAGTAVDDEVRVCVLTAMGRLLSRGWMCAGDLENVPPISPPSDLIDDAIAKFRGWHESGGRTRFAPWIASTEEALGRVRDSWAALGRDPWPGEVCWLQNTTAGNAHAASMRAE